MVGKLHLALLRDLWHLRSQVIAVGLVAACGIAALVTMRCTYVSLVQARADYYQQNRFADIFVHLKRAPASLEANLLRTPGVADLQTRVLEDVTLSVPGLDEPATGRLISLKPGTEDERMMNALALRAGRYPVPGSDTEVIASETFASANGLLIGSRLGALLNGHWRDLTVVGLALSPEYIYEVGPAMIFPDNRRFGVLWMDDTALAAAFNMKGAFNDVSLTLGHGASEKDVVDAIDRELSVYGGLNAYGRADQASYRFLNDELAEISVNSTYIPAIFLSVAAFLIYTLMARLVGMQRRQIALLKAFGYSNLRIGVHYLEFSICVIAVGLLLGLAAGAWLGGSLVGIYRQYFHFPVLNFRLYGPVVSSAAAIAAGSALLGALGAVGLAVRLAPADAMRPEAPGQFRIGALERLGLLRGLSGSQRVIVRNMARRPVRAVLSTLGIAAAIACVTVGRFAFDAVDQLMSVHFNSAEREDAMVLLREVAGESAHVDLQHMTGVLRVEAFRAVPVRLRYTHHQKQCVLLGLPGDGTLRQIVDAQRRRIDLPPDGVVLTRKLAELLSARAGDVLTIEQLDGRRLTFPEQIVKLSDEPVGIGAYMEAKALSRALQEAGTISGAAVQLDPARTGAFYQELKRTPAVGSVAVREAMLQTIRDSMNRSFIMMTIVMTMFAAVLVAGVVYNSARIALSERGNELASLRVLGFRKGEVVRLLLGEQLVLTVAAIPLGLAFGMLIERLLVPVFNRELFRLPYVVSARTLSFAVAATLLSALATAVVVARRISRLDLIEVLKARE